MENTKMVIGVDVDGVVADLHPVWLALYNKEFSDNKTVEDMKEHWSVTRILKKECSTEKMISYLHLPDLYHNVKPIVGALEGIQAIRARGHRVVLVTACEKGTEGGKYDWVTGYKTITRREDWLVMKDKSLAAVDVLIDDKEENINTFPKIGVIFDAPYNKECKALRLNGWADISRILDIIEKKNDTILDSARKVVYGTRQNDYGSPLTNHTRTADFFTTYLQPRLVEGKRLTAEDVSMLNILQKVSRGMNSITRDTAVDIAGYAENIGMIKTERGEW
jgi:5'(3')-deoxyribonucleotidase